MTTMEEALEGSTPLAEKIRAGGPYHSTDEVVARMRALLPTLNDAERVATLNAHPRIGEAAGRLSARALKEQGGDALPELDRLNAEYERRFGFRFVVFVNRRPKRELVPVLEQRLQRSRQEELDTAVEELVAIAEDRWRHS